MSWRIISGMRSPGRPVCMARSPSLRYRSLYHAVQVSVFCTLRERSCRSRRQALSRSQRSVAKARPNQSTNNPVGAQDSSVVAALVARDEGIGAILATDPNVEVVLQ